MLSVLVILIDICVLSGIISDIVVIIIVIFIFGHFRQGQLVLVCLLYVMKKVFHYLTM